MGKVCYLCKSDEDEELLYGKFYTKWKISVHYYCLLLSSNLVQNGVNDTVGIFGFLEQDIRRENERTKKCRCYICKRPHANVSCCAKKCLRTFHTVCGIRNRCLSHYTDTFQSWCSNHIPLKSESKKHAPDEPCSICYDEMGPYERIGSIRAPCCKNGWFHQRCLAQYAQSAGYFFKCPLCKNEDTFLAEIPLRGVFVPERDAAWELEPNAFQEQLLRPTACDAEECKCDEGRTKDNRQWRLVVCGSCGSTCRHRQCMEQHASSRSYVCQLCKPIVGERITVGEEDDSSDDSEDDARSSVSSVSSRVDEKQLKIPGSGESGVDCSSSDELLINLRRKPKRQCRAPSTDSERSDASCIQIRRFIKQNTGKRVRRIMTDESDTASERSPAPPVPVKPTTGSEKEQLADETSLVDSPSSSPPSPLSVERSPAKDENELSNMSDTSISNVSRKRSRKSYRLQSPEDSDRKRTDSETSVIQPARLTVRRSARIITSSDDSDNTSSERGGRSDSNKDEIVPVALRRAISAGRSTVSESDTSESPIEENGTNGGTTESESGGKPTQSTLILGKRTTSESDCSDIPYKRPHRKRRRISSERYNKPGPYISPPSTPPSMTSDASQLSAGGGSSGTDERAEGNKLTSPSARTQTGTPNRQVQQSMLLFVKRDAHQGRVSDGSSSAEIASPSPRARSLDGGGKASSDKSATGPKRRRRPAKSPKQKTTNSPAGNEGDRSLGDNSSSASPNSASPASASSSRKKSVQKQQHKHKQQLQENGQKNILSYFNRC